MLDDLVLQISCCLSKVPSHSERTTDVMILWTSQSVISRKV